MPGDARSMVTTRGIAIALPQKSVDSFFSNYARLREIGCTLPVEVWETGGELDNATLARIAAAGLRHKTLGTFVQNPEKWRGWQIKGAIPSFTAFDELILVDADVCFARDPTILFASEEYRTTGTYFFRDEQSKWVFFGTAGSSWRCKTCQSRKFYNDRKRWLRGLFGPTMPPGFPPEWGYHWEGKGYTVNATKEVMDSGVVVIDRRRHPGLLREVFELNENHEDTYKHVWGDKETFWLGAMLAHEPYALARQEATHECCSLLCFRTLRYSQLWRHRAARNKGSKLRGLIQRDPSGRALFYHRKAEDVAALDTLTLDWNQWLCDRGWSIHDDQVPGFRLNHPVVYAVEHIWTVVFAAAAACLLIAVLCCRRRCWRLSPGRDENKVWRPTAMALGLRRAELNGAEDHEPLLPGR